MDNSQIRKENITSILKSQFGDKKVSLAQAIGKNPVVVQRWFSEGKGRRNLGDKVAREIEDKLQLPRGWLDNIHKDNFDLEQDPQKKSELKSDAGHTITVPLKGSALIDHQFLLTTINNKKGKLMILSTDGDAYAFQLIGHNPNPILDNKWGLVVEPNTRLTQNEYALIWLENGEILLRIVAFLDDDAIVVRHPLSGEQSKLSRSQVSKAEYCYLGIPPSKITPDDDESE